MHKISVTILSLALLTSVSACSTVSSSGTTSSTTSAGSTLIEVGNVLVDVECSSLTPVVGSVASNILNIIAPNSTAADLVSTVLATNTTIAAKLCPAVAAIKASVGTVPAGTPTQVVSVSNVAKLSAVRHKLSSSKYGTTVILNNGALPIIKTYE
jgi:hypothetical protein